jgi:hypothetical protein
MDLLWGGDDWRSLVGHEPIPSGPLTHEQRVRVSAPWVKAFRERVQRILGLISDESPPLIINDRNSAMYHLLFFTNDQTGLRIWRKLKAIDASGQRSLGIA